MQNNLSTMQHNQLKSVHLASFNTSPLQHKSHLDIKTAPVFNLATQCPRNTKPRPATQVCSSVHATQQNLLYGKLLGKSVRFLQQHSEHNRFCNTHTQTNSQNFPATQHIEISLLIFPATQNSISCLYISYATQGPATQKS